MPDPDCAPVDGQGESVDQLKQKLQAIERWREGILQALDYLQSGLVLYGPDDVLILCNRRFREIYPEIADLLVPGVAYETIARTFYRRKFFSMTTLTEDEYAHARVTQHLNPDECDSEYLMGEGSWILSSDRKTPDGGVIGFRLDISARKLVEQRLAEAEQRVTRELEGKVQERTNDLLEANRSLAEVVKELRETQRQLVQSEKLASLGFLVAGVAHEINTPIGNALMAGTTLKDEAELFARASVERVTRGRLDSHIDTVSKGTSILVANLERAAKLVQGFKQLALDRATEQRRQFVLAEVIDEVVLAMGPQLKKCPFKLVTDVASDITMDSYPGPLTQIVVNFINNALIHAFDGRSSGGMRLDATLTGDGCVEIAFSDDGCGMTPEVAARVFDPFFTTKLGQGGNGLGMHIAYNVATQLLGGSIQVESQPGAGSCWRLKVPQSLSAP